jgi:hypothetical protein
MTKAAFTSDTYTPDRLIATNPGLLNAVSITLISGQNLARGALLGKITASGKYTLSLSAASDGSQVPDAILVDAVNASGGDVVCPAYNRGDFQAQAVILGASHTVASVREGLRAKGITLIDTQGGV